MPQICSVNDFSNKALVELKSWLEPWFLTRDRAGRAGNSLGSGSLGWEDVGISVGGNRELMMVFDGGAGVLTTGIKGEASLDFNCTITAWRLLADQTGSCVLNIWKDTYGNYPPTVADKITASAPPTLSSALKANDSTLVGWTTSVAAGDTFRFNLDSVSSIQRLTLALSLAT